MDTNSCPKTFSKNSHWVHSCFSVAAVCCLFDRHVQSTNASCVGVTESSCCTQWFVCRLSDQGGGRSVSGGGGSRPNPFL